MIICAAAMVYWFCNWNYTMTTAKKTKILQRTLF
jgi:hypothetical protein